MKNTFIHSTLGLAIMTILIFTPVQSAHAGWREDMISLFDSLIQRIIEIQESLFSGRYSESERYDSTIVPNPPVPTSYDCNNIPATMGPESLEWQKQCNSAVMPGGSETFPEGYCSRIPTTMGPESIEWQRRCNNSAPVPEKTRILEPLPEGYCNNIPTTMGPESLEWQKRCGSTPDTDKDYFPVY